MYCFRHLLIPSCCIISGCKDICSQRDPDKQVGKNIDQSCSRTYRRKSLASAEPSHYNNIHGIKHQLQDTCEHERKGKGNQLIHNGSVAHINLELILFHGHFPQNSLSAKLILLLCANFVNRGCPECCLQCCN